MMNASKGCLQEKSRCWEYVEAMGKVKLRYEFGKADFPNREDVIQYLKEKGIAEVAE